MLLLLCDTDTKLSIQIILNNTHSCSKICCAWSYDQVVQLNHQRCIAGTVPNTADER